MVLNFTFDLSLDPGINLLFFLAASAHLGMSAATVCGVILFAEFRIHLKQESTSHYIQHILNKGWCGPVRHGGSGGWDGWKGIYPGNSYTFTRHAPPDTPYALCIKDSKTHQGIACGVEDYSSGKSGCSIVLVCCSAHGTSSTGAGETHRAEDKASPALKSPLAVLTPLQWTVETCCEADLLGWVRTSPCSCKFHLRPWVLQTSTHTAQWSFPVIVSLGVDCRAESRSMDGLCFWFVP